MNADINIFGDWRVTSHLQTEQLLSRSTNYKNYLADGSFSQFGYYIISAIDEEVALRVVTAAYREEGTWRREGNDLEELISTSETLLFSSSVEEYDRASYEADESRTKPTIYEMIEVDGEGASEVIHLREKEEPEEKYQMVRQASSITEADFLREVSLGVLQHDGFGCSPHLPKRDPRATLRSRESIIKRAMSFYIMICWVTAPKSKMPSRELKKLIADFDLEVQLTEQERGALALSRRQANRQLSESVGWRIENLWALAWVLGFEETPDIDQGQIVEEVIAVLVPFMESGIEKPSNFVIRPAAEVVQLEDMFYCAHNAVRSSQIGHDEALPEDFHPLLDGGVIHEKRHALSWALAPDQSWDAVSLDT